MSLKRWSHLAALIILALPCLPANAQSNASQPDLHINAHSGTLFNTIQAQDTKLFDAYNHCDLATLSEMMSADLEFYHDKTGLSVGKAPFIAAIKQNVCGKVERTLVPGSLEVYPLNGYGAVEIGVHRFHHPGNPQDGVGEAKFVTIWRYRNGTWQVTRAISFDHEPAAE